MTRYAIFRPAAKKQPQSARCKDYFQRGQKQKKIQQWQEHLLHAGIDGQDNAFALVMKYHQFVISE